MQQLAIIQLAKCLCPAYTDAYAVSDEVAFYFIYGTVALNN